MHGLLGRTGLAALGFLILAQATLASAAPLEVISPNPSRTTYAEVKTFMRELVAQYPQNAKLFTLGMSNSGIAIEGVALGNGPVKNLIVAAHHGNEYGSVETARGVAASLAEHPIVGQTVYVVPVLNLAGYDA